MLRRVLTALMLSALIAAPALAADAPIYADQGANWTPDKRKDFYTRDQGSQIIPLPWLNALKQPNGEPFLAGSLARYGYLPNEEDKNGLPVGFTASGPTGAETVGMTCSACHTRQITAEGKTYRIDGGPAIADFQSFLADLDAAIGNVRSSEAAFRDFANNVLGSATPGSAAPDPTDIAGLRMRVERWYLPYHALITRALPNPPWGPGRLDAISMIFNRVTGLDIGPPPSFLIEENIRPAIGPVRYPFLWNAPMQDKTQWPGFADNGNDVLALSRNLGQVYGVFGVFQPKKEGLVVNFLNNNTANFDSLGVIENLLRQIGSPRWPWPVDKDLAAQGELIFARSQDAGGCVGCHGKSRGIQRFPNVETWHTPIQNVGTDTREFDVITRRAKSGVLQGVSIPVITEPLQKEDFAFYVLATSVLGSIGEHVLRASGDTLATVAKIAQAQLDAGLAAVDRPGPFTLPPALKNLEGAFNAPINLLKEAKNEAGQLKTPTPREVFAAVEKGAYESRVLDGIWAAAPYLHNGSVPTLAELLKSPAERVKSFKVGNAYDTNNVGLAVEQTQFNHTLMTTDCTDLNSGNSNCGHDFGTQLSPDEKKALLEYLKTL